MTNKFLLFFILFCGLPVVVHASPSDFIPRLKRPSAVLRLESSYQSDSDSVERNGSTAKKPEVKTLKFQETLQVGTSGYVYHPNLFLFASSLSGIRSSSRETLSSENAVRPPKKTRGWTEGYNFYGELLRRKPLNAEMRFSRTVPFGSGAVHKEHALRQVQVHYLERPFTGILEYVQNLREDSLRSNTDDQYRASVGYNWSNFTIQVGGGHARNRSRQSASASIPASTTLAQTDRLNLSSQWLSDFLTFYTTSEWSELDNSDEIDTHTGVRGDMDAVLPWNFDLRVKLLTARDVSAPKEGDTPDLVRSNKSADARLTQKLFESLDSNLHTSFQRIESAGGGQELKSYGYGTAYSKRLRGGGFSAGTSFQAILIDSNGRVDDEQEFNGKIAGQNFLISRQDIDLDTISLFITIDNSDYMLQENVHWTKKNPTTSSVEIDLRDLALDATDLQQFIIDRGGDGVAGAYTYTAQFKTQNLDYVQETDRTDAYAGIALLDNMLKSKYSHSYTAQKISEGEAGFHAGLAPVVTSDTIEGAFAYAPFSFSATYRLVNTEYDAEQFELAKRGDPILKNETWNLGVSFNKNVTIISSVTSAISARYFKTLYNAEQYNSDPTVQNIEKLTGDKYTYFLGARSSLLLPALKAKLGHDMRFESRRGRFPELVTTSNNRYEANPINSDDLDIFESELNLRWKVPRTKIAVTGFVDYKNENYIEGNRTIKTNYGTKSGYGWHFGATSLNISGEYTVEENQTEAASGDTSKTTNEEWVVRATLLRKLL